MLVTRTGGSRGATSVTVRTRGGTARSGATSRPRRTLVRFAERRHLAAAGRDPDRARTRRPSARRTSRSRSTACAARSSVRSASATRHDPRRRPAAATRAGRRRRSRSAAPSTVFKGLGARAHEPRRRSCQSRRNGTLHLPRNRSQTARPTMVDVKTQPHNPDQACTVQHGAGHVAERERDRHRGALRRRSPRPPASTPPSAPAGASPRPSAHRTGRGGRDPAQRAESSPPGWRTGRRPVLTSRSRATTPPATSTRSFGTNGIATTDLGGAGRSGERRGAAPRRRDRRRRRRRRRRVQKHGLRRSSATSPTAPRTRTSAPAESSEPTSSARATSGRTPSASSPTARSSSPGFAAGASGIDHRLRPRPLQRRRNARHELRHRTAS